MSSLGLRARSSASQSQIRAMLQIAVACGAVYLVWIAVEGRFEQFSMVELGARLADTSVWAVAAAFIFAAISLTAFSAYDVLAFRAVGVNAPLGAMMRSGAAATGLGQTLGFGLIVGGFTRWRMMRGHGATPGDAAKATALVTMGFFFGAVAVAAFAAVVAPRFFADALAVSVDMVRGTALFVLSGTVAAMIVADRLGDRRQAAYLAKLAALAACDLVPAALALWVLLPEGVEIGYWAVLAAFVAAMALGLFSNAPGGVGVFEGVLLVALPFVPLEALVASLLVFRAIYFGAPFLLALALLADQELGRPLSRGLGAARGRVAPRRAPAQTISAGVLNTAIAQSERAEAHLAFLGDKKFLVSEAGDAFLMYGRRFGVIVAMGDPVGPRRAWPELIDRFIALAGSGGVAPAFYKAGPTTAALCRSRGLIADRIGHEAEIDPQAFALDIPSRRQLRRKLRQAEKAGVALQWREPGEANLNELAAISADWVGEKGGERGFSMGRFREDYVRRFPVVEARIDDQLVGFITIWRSGDGAEWSIDLMRFAEDAPLGVMQSLITGAIEAAKDAGVDRFNLCMAPFARLGDANSFGEKLAHAVYEHFGERLGLHGLHRLKAAFAPEWRPRYLVRKPGLRSMMAPAAAHSLIASPPDRRDG